MRTKPGASVKKKRIGSDKIRQAYMFLAEAESTGAVFSFDAFVRGSGWAATTARANLTKKLRQYVIKEDGGYRVTGVTALTQDAFCRVCSQNSALAGDPLKPSLTPKAEGLVVKARDAALAAVQNYNNPTAVFRSGNYIILMVIAYTALFHAIFERDGVDYKEKGSDGHPKMVGPLPMLWDAVHSARHYAENHCRHADKRMVRAMAKNLEFFAPIRNQIEHRFMPQFDQTIAGECQAMLMNFETILVDEFTPYYSLNQSLTLALQFSTRRTAEAVDALRKLQSEEYKAMKEYIDTFRAELSDEIFGNPAYAFRVLLIPKPVSDARKSDISIEFIKVDPNDPEQTAELERQYVAIRQALTTGIGDPSQICHMWEFEVVDTLRERLGRIVAFGAGQKELNGSMIRDIIKAHHVATPSRKYYRPGKKGSRAQYGPELLDWITDEYQKDQQFFYNARLAAATVASPD